ncbi:MAG: substrate-binding domain-containing protein [Oculatellaceae cyanobacterium bins.114]|nr:substrate-binding domain-containing protein [Oculatellaceae cyanobacterium bins.114]
MKQKQSQRPFLASLFSGGQLATSNQGSLTQRRMKRRSLLISLGIIAFASVITFAPLPGLQRTVIVVGGTELQEVLPTLEARFEQQNPSIDLDLRFQGSQDVVNNYIDDKNDFTPTVLIPASADLIAELGDRWRAQNGDEPFYDAPRPIAKTILVAIAWADRGGILFPNGTFQWQRVEAALQAGNWGSIGGAAEWGSVDLVTTDPTRSNSAQLALSLWAQSKLGGGALNPGALNDPAIASLFGLVKRSVYQPPRSTDVLLQEFITRGPNDADVAVVYESIALYRWQQSATTQGKPYQIYYIDPTVETVSTGAIVRRNVDGGTADAARQFLDFLAQPEQQAVFVQYGFRPVDGSLDLRSVPNSPWSQNIPGAEVDPPGVTPPPDRDTLTEVIRLWQRAS